MPEYKLMPDGSIVFTSLDEVLEAQRQQAARRSAAHDAHDSVTRSASVPKREPAPPVEPEEPAAPQDEHHAAWDRFMGYMKEKQRDTLRAIKAHDNITLTELVAAVGAEQTSSVAGYLTGIIRNAEKAGIKLSDVFKRTEQGYGPSRVLRYRPGPLLRAHDVTA